ncbi:AmmeMemoRadiSam system protein B [bacterium]|nr:AmmeMemoRadiSam system protein B [candidate division CSSED10-310 bacterium]
MNEKTDIIENLLSKVPVPSTEHCRGILDLAGYPQTPEQMDTIKAAAETARSTVRSPYTEQFKDKEPVRFLAGICPHDDYYYASRFYALLLPYLVTKTVIIFGVTHKHRLFNTGERLAFDSFNFWKGPYGPVPVSPLRDRLTDILSHEECIVDDRMHILEHSIEAIIPFLQAYRHDVTIVPILVPPMSFSRLTMLAGKLAGFLANFYTNNQWMPGEDISVLCSNDCVHYGDSGWGGSGYAPFGTDVNGYLKAVDQDREIIRKHLTGRISSPMLEAFLQKMTVKDDAISYGVTWCGRYTVTFGLEVARKISRQLTGRHLEGVLLDYGTSVSEASFDSLMTDGLGPTAPNNFHHFVGYASIGYL